ncbi:PBP1 and LysM peptidoglycan-binding domain-containing protein [Postechiella marina]
MVKIFSVFCLIYLLNISTVQAQNFSTHQVKKGETIEALAKRYNVSLSQIYSYNPDAKEGLKPNTILIIPKSKTPQPKVTEIKELQGFKEHKTKRKETLYSLSKKYNVLEEDIKKYNKFLYANPLRKNDKIQIPIFKITEVVEEVKTNKTYTVLPKEGKWRVAYKFGITVKELEELNPDMGEVLQPGQKINVPNIDAAKEKTVDEKYSYYKVLPKEGFYRLKLKLGIEQAELEKLNPGLKESGLKAGTILKIPFNKAVAATEDRKENVDLATSITDFSTKHIAVMLPFRLNRVDFDSISGTKNSITRDPYLRASLDFHSGVLMAVDQLKALGVSLKVDVYDTKNQVSEVDYIIKNNNFETVDAVIGPLIAKTFQRAAVNLKPLHIPVISPIGNNLKLHDNVFQSKPADGLIKSRIINFVKADTLVNNIIIISDVKHTAVANELKREFNRATIVYSRKNKEGQDENYVVVDDIKNVLKPGKNIVFLETKNEGFASNVTSILNSLIQVENSQEKLKEISIVLATTNKNKAFEGDEISNEHLSNLQFHFATASKESKEEDDDLFIKQYTKAYKETPNSRAVLGYDLTMDTVLRLVTSSDLYMSVNEAPLTEYVENKFAYKKKLFGGYYNDTVYLVKYDDLSIVEVE